MEGEVALIILPQGDPLGESGLPVPQLWIPWFTELGSQEGNASIGDKARIPLHLKLQLLPSQFGLLCQKTGRQGKESLSRQEQLILIIRKSYGHGHKKGREDHGWHSDDLRGHLLYFLTQFLQ